MAEVITLPAMIDAHLHLRQDDLPPPSNNMTQIVAPWSAMVCSDVIVMPNTIPPTHWPNSIAHYRRLYESALGPNTRVHMTAKWLPRTTPEDVRKAKEAGAIGFKLYPKGATTNSDDGIAFNDLRLMTDDVVGVLRELEKEDMVLMCHGEAPAFVMDRELAFLSWFKSTAMAFPRLRMTLEHITTASGINMIYELNSWRRNVLGTITVHHMMRTLDNVIGDKLKPDEFCMPIPKRPEDRDTILATAKNYLQDCFAFGSDSAPHHNTTKYCSSGCAGVYSAPTMLQTLVELLGVENGGVVYKKFCVENARKFYRLPESNKVVKLMMEDTMVPQSIDGLTPFRAGEVLKWRLVS